MNDTKIKSPIGDLPNPFTIHDGIFGDVEEAKFAIRGVLRAYFGSENDQEEDYLFFKSVAIRFAENPEFDLEMDHRRRTLIFVVKEPRGKDVEKVKAQIRQELTMSFASIATDMRGRTAMSIYRALEPAARTAIQESERQKDHEGYEAEGPSDE